MNTTGASTAEKCHPLLPIRPPLAQVEELAGTVFFASCQELVLSEGLLVAHPAFAVRPKYYEIIH